MRVKIVKEPDFKESWYFGMVGEEFEVNSEIETLSPYKDVKIQFYSLSDNDDRVILIEDCEIVPDQPGQPEPTRKIVQIMATQTGTTEYLYALCNDGSVWFMMDPSKEEKWERLPEIPQD